MYEDRAAARSHVSDLAALARSTVRADRRHGAALARRARSSRTNCCRGSRISQHSRMTTSAADCRSFARTRRSSLRALTPTMTTRRATTHDGAASRLRSALQMQLRFEEAKRQLAAPPCAVNTRDTDGDRCWLGILRAEILHVDRYARPRWQPCARRSRRCGRQALPTGAQAMLDHAEGRVAIGVAPAEGSDATAPRDRDWKTSSTRRERATRGWDELRASSRSTLLRAVMLQVHCPSLAKRSGSPPRPNCVLGLVGDDRDLVAIARERVRADECRARATYSRHRARQARRQGHARRRSLGARTST